MSILYCSIPHFATALMQRDDPTLTRRPLILLGPDGHVFDASGDATSCGVIPGIPGRAAEVRCPSARLMEVNLAHCRAQLETLWQTLERNSPAVEPHGCGCAYVDLAGLTRGEDDAVAFCSQIGQVIRRELGEPLQPALGWNSTKFTAQAAAWRTQAGRLLSVPAVREVTFLRPLPVTLLPLNEDSLLRLGFLGLHTLGQYAALPPDAVLQQFGPAGKLALQCARGEDNRPVIPRSQEQQLTAGCDCDAPNGERELLLAVLRRLVEPLLRDLRDNLRACGQIRLTVQLVDGSTQEQERTLLQPTSDEKRTLLVLGQLLDAISWTTAAMGLQITLERIQDSMATQLTIFPSLGGKEHQLSDVQNYLTARFGTNRLRRATLEHPAAPLPEWRANWLEWESA
jgi:protein ImuB